MEDVNGYRKETSQQTIEPLTKRIPEDTVELAEKKPVEDLIEQRIRAAEKDNVLTFWKRLELSPENSFFPTDMAVLYLDNPNADAAVLNETMQTLFPSTEFRGTFREGQTKDGSLHVPSMQFNLESEPMEINMGTNTRVLNNNRSHGSYRVTFALFPSASAAQEAIKRHARSNRERYKGVALQAQFDMSVSPEQLAAIPKPPFLYPIPDLPAPVPQSIPQELPKVA